MPKEYNDFFIVFSKKNSDILPFYQKYDYKILLEEEQKPGHAPIYKISSEEFSAIKRYLNLHLAKDFIQANLTSFSSPPFFVKKLNREI